VELVSVVQAGVIVISGVDELKALALPMVLLLLHALGAVFEMGNLIGWGDDDERV
jgi:hypothetical protein